MSDIIFADGVKVKKVSDTLYGVSIKFKDFADWAFEYKNENGFLNLNIQKSKNNDNWYCCLNSWKPESKETVKFEEGKFPF